MSRTASANKIADQNVKYVVQVDNDNPPGSDRTEDSKSGGSRSVRAALVFAVLIVASAGAYLGWQAAIGESTVAEEAMEVIGVEAIATNIVTLEPEFSDFEDIATGKGWTKLERADPAAELSMIIALELRNVDILEKRLVAAATPGTPDYGYWLTKDEITEMTSPEQSAIDAVLAWHGSTLEHYHEGGFIKRTVTVAEAEHLLNSEYYVFEHTNGDHVIRMISEYGVDSSVAPYISFASPSVRFPASSEMESTLTFEKLDTDLSSPPNDDFYDSISRSESQPDFLRTLYNITDTATEPSNRQAVAEFLTQIFSQSDQNTFYDYFYPKAAGQKITVKGYSVSQDGSMSGVETMLDTEYIVVTGTGVETENWSYMYDRQKTSRQTCPFLDWILDVGTTDDDIVPKVFSVSYGDDESNVGATYARRLAVEFMKAGARGISILFASGDSGANCYRGKFTPDFPASIPYVTAVGGTRGGDDQDIATWRYSSGGFSNIFGRPSWQDNVVTKYTEVDGVMEKAQKYGANIVHGRGFPDVSAMAVGYPVVCSGFAYLVSGTSCASPVFAGIIALLNDHLIKNGKSTLGFLNPWLYSSEVSKTLVDVLGDYSSGCTTVGWVATEGWDPVTGIGYPNYALLKSLL